MSLFGVNPLWSQVAIIGASLPVAANVFILARQYDTYVDRTSGAILVSTIVSVATVSVLLILLTRGEPRRSRIEFPRFAPFLRLAPLTPTPHSSPGEADSEAALTFTRPRLESFAG